jgi:hypothetical protein
MDRILTKDERLDAYLDSLEEYDLNQKLLIITKKISKELIDYLHEKEEDIDDEASIPNQEERQYRERLRLTIGQLRVSKEQEMYWSTDDNLRKLLRHRPSIDDMKLILRPMSYLSEEKRKRLSIFNDMSLERERYFINLQKQLIEYFLEQYNHES